MEELYMKLAAHGANYKRSQLNGLDKHNYRRTRNHSNKEIRSEDSNKNIIIKSPDKSLYQDAKQRIESVVASGGKVKVTSNWMCEWIIYAPPEISEPDELKRYYEIVTDYFASKVGLHNIIGAIAHCDESSNHCHLDFIPITTDGRLSSKEIMSRKFLFEVHNELSVLLKDKGYNIERGESTPELGKRSLSVNVYKKQAEMQRSLIQNQMEELKLEIDLLNKIYDELLYGNEELAEMLLSEENGYEYPVR